MFNKFEVIYSSVSRFIQELLPKMKGMVYIPKVYHDMTTRKVLVTEWIEGEKLASSPKEVINKLTPVGIECFLCQLLETGQLFLSQKCGKRLQSLNTQTRSPFLLSLYILQLQVL